MRHLESALLLANRLLLRRRFHCARLQRPHGSNPGPEHRNHAPWEDLEEFHFRTQHPKCGVVGNWNAPWRRHWRWRWNDLEERRGGTASRVSLERLKRISTNTLQGRSRRCQPALVVDPERVNRKLYTDSDGTCEEWPGKNNRCRLRLERWPDQGRPGNSWTQILERTAKPRK